MAFESTPDQKLPALLRQAFFLGWFAQFILNAIGFHWIAITATEFGHFPMWAGIITLIGFCAIAHVYYGLAGALALFIFKKLERSGIKLSATAFITMTFSLFGMIEALWPAIFPWHLGYTWLWGSFPGAQFSDVIGFEGLNLITLACNALFAIGWIRYASSEKTFLLRARPSARWIIAGLALFLGTNLLGLGREKMWRETDGELKLLIAQGNIGNYEKLIVEHQKNFSVGIINTYVRLSAAGFEKYPEATHVLWPETAYPDYLDSAFQNEPNWNTIRQFAVLQRKSVMTGAYSYDPMTKKTFNGFFGMDANGILFGPPYRKSILIPFGERFPFSDVIPYMKWLFPGLGSFGAGAGPTSLDFRDFKLGPQVCLESLYPEFSAAMARKGAEIFSNVTNDSWFGQTFEPYQHMTMTLARAIENRRPLLRATNTGISTVVLADGTVLEKSPMQSEWVGFYLVPFKKNPPVVTYSKIAGYTPWLAALLAILSASLSALKARRRSR